MVNHLNHCLGLYIYYIILSIICYIYMKSLLNVSLSLDYWNEKLIT